MVAGTNGLEIIDISKPLQTKTAAIGKISMASSYDVTLKDDLAYVAAGTDGLKIVDVSDPGSPVLLGGKDTSSANRVKVGVPWHMWQMVMAVL